MPVYPERLRPMREFNYGSQSYADLVRQSLDRMDGGREAELYALRKARRLPGVSPRRHGSRCTATKLLTDAIALALSRKRDFSGSSFPEPSGPRVGSAMGTERFLIALTYFDTYMRLVELR
jgi:hypothetical protein